MAQNVFGHLIPSATPQMAQPQNDPIIAPVDPYKQASEARARAGEGRAVVDQQLQVEAANRSAATAAREAEAARKRDLEWNATHNPDGTPKNGQGGSVEQGKSAGFLRRALGANDDYEAQNIGARSWVGQTLAESAPNLLNNLPASVGNSPERQVADAAQDDFIAATLRYESGAAIPPEEMNAQKRRYFPVAGDSKDAIDAKRKLRERAIEALSLSAGPLSEQVYAEWQKSGAKDGDDESPLQVTVTDDSPETPTATPPTGGGGAPDLDPRFFNPEGAQGIFDLAKQGISGGLSDEAAGIGEALSTVFTGGDALDAYRQGRDLERENLRRAREAHPVIGRAAEFLGGGASARVASIPNSLGGLIRQGAGIGALTGFGYGEGAQGSAIGAGVGAGVGAGLSAAGGAIGNALASRAARNAPTAEQTALVEAGQRQGIPVRQIDARPELRNRVAQLETTPTGGPILQAARRSDAEAIEQRAAEIAGGQAFDKADNTALGQAAQRVAQRGNENVKQAASDLYTRVERTAPDFKTAPNQTVAFIDSKIAELKARSPSGYNAEVSALEGMKSDLQQTGLSVPSLQAQRETVGGRIGDNIADRTRADKTFTEVLDVAGSELHSALRAENPNAASLLSRADAKWGQYKRLQNEVTSKFLGKRGDATAETAARALNAAGRNDYSALRRFMAIATPEERADFGATFVQNWGSNARGEFSPAIFAKNMENVSDRTLAAVLGSDGRRAMRDLQLLSNAKTDAGSRMQPSGVSISNAAGGLKTLLMSALGFGAAGPGGAAAGAVGREFLSRWGEQRAARMLLNPDFTKWLRSAPNTTNPRAINAYFSRLGTIASIPANDNQAFQQALVQSVRQSPGRAAADQEADRRREPPQ